MPSPSDVNSASSGDTHSSYTDEDNSTEDDTWEPIYDLDHEWDPAFRPSRAAHDSRTVSQPPPRRRRPPVAASEASSSGAPPQILRPGGGARTGPPSTAVSGDDVIGAYGRYPLPGPHMPPYTAGRGYPPGGYGGYPPQGFGAPQSIVPYGQQAPEFPHNPFSPNRQAGPGGYPYPSSPFGPPGAPPPGYTGHELAHYGAQQPGPYGFQGYGDPRMLAAQYGYGFPAGPSTEAANNPGTPAPKVAEPAPAPAPAPVPEPPKIDPETEKKLAAQQEDIEKQQKNLAEMKAKEAEQLAKMAELTNFINESKAREQKMKDDAERAAEMAKRIAEEVAKAKAEMAAAQAAKEIADKQAKYDAEVAAAAAAKKQAEKEAAEAAAKAAYEKDIKDKADAEVAAAKAKVEAEAADAKAKAEAEVAAAKAEAEAAKAKVPADKKKPIKFKDALGRKFNFPFELCATWKGMNELICQAFMHVEPHGAMVQEGNYDLIGPGGEIILPQIWETVIEPDWTITMHMWPIKEPPKKEEPEPQPGWQPGMHTRRRGGKAPGPGHAGRGAGHRDRAPPVPPPPPPPPPAGLRQIPIPGEPGWIGPMPTRHTGHPGVEVLPDRPKKKKQQTSTWSFFGPQKKTSKK